MFNTKLKNKIKQLESEVTELKRQNRYYAGQYDSWRGKTTILAAEDIIRRFNELYDHLGIEREIIPATSAHPKLAKKKKASNA